MRAIFDISETVDDTGIPTYKAMLPSDFDAEGVPDPSAPVGYGETVWEAIAALMGKLDDVDPTVALFMGEEAL